MVRLPRKEEVINVGKTGNRYTPRFQFQVVLEILKGDKEAVEIARAYGIHPGTVSTWKQEFLNKGPELFGKDTTLAQYEKRISELERLLGRKEVEIALLKNFTDGSL